MQRRLAELGYLSGTPDGVFGKATKAAVKDFQRASGLTADGIAGAATLVVLYSEAAVARPAPTATVTPQKSTTKNAATVYVWITRTGSKYHRTDHCGNTKHAARVTLQEAIDMGYEPCGNCY